MQFQEGDQGWRKSAWYNVWGESYVAENFINQSWWIGNSCCQQYDALIQQYHALFWLLHLVYCIARITLYFVSHMALFFYGWIWKFSLHQHSVWVARTCAKYALWTVTMSFHKCLSILMRLKAITSIYNHYCTCLPQVWLVHCLPVDCWVC